MDLSYVRGNLGSNLQIQPGKLSFGPIGVIDVVLWICTSINDSLWIYQSLLERQRQSLLEV